MLNETHHLFGPVGEISPVHRRISSVWRVTPVFRKICSRWVFAVVAVMPSVAAVSASVRPANRLGEQAGFGRRQTKGGGDCVGTILLVRLRTDEHGRDGRGLQPRAEIAACERQDVGEDRRHIGEADRQPGLANAGRVSGRKGDGAAQLGCG